MKISKYKHKTEFIKYNLIWWYEGVLSKLYNSIYKYCVIEHQIRSSLKNYPIFQPKSRSKKLFGFEKTLPAPNSSRSFLNWKALRNGTLARLAPFRFTPSVNKPSALSSNYPSPASLIPFPSLPNIFFLSVSLMTRLSAARRGKINCESWKTLLPPAAPPFTEWIQKQAYLLYNPSRCTSVLESIIYTRES